MTKVVIELELEEIRLLFEEAEYSIEDSEYEMEQNPWHFEEADYESAAERRVEFEQVRAKVEAAIKSVETLE